jgi:hypothetical protein
MARKRKIENNPIASVGASSAQARHKTAGTIRVKHSPVPAEPLSSSTLEPEFTAVTSSEPSQEEIARLAYTYWEARGQQGGCPEEDWLRAERELRSRSAA